MHPLPCAPASLAGRRLTRGFVAIRVPQRGGAYPITIDRKWQRARGGLKRWISRGVSPHMC
jgi:hypothetical protein